jgi:N-acyl homoserine lactone hydrolase
MKLYLLKLALIQPVGVPVPGYLIQANDGTNILIDTGIAYSTIAAPQGVGGMTPQMTEEDYVVNRLAALGLTPQDIGYVVCTHFDGDHAGNYDAFSDAEFIVQRSHYEFARSGHPRFEPTRDQWERPNLHYRLIDGDVELAPGVELIETSGHVPGHQSVLVRLPETGPVLLAIDAILDQTRLNPLALAESPFDMALVGVRASTQKLIDRAQRECVRLIICGHDSVQWLRLKHTPEFYG